MDWICHQWLQSRNADQQFCVKGSTTSRVCGRDTCKFSHLLDFNKITTGTYALNQWVNKIPNFNWATKPLANAVAKPKNNDEAGKTIPP